MTDEADESNSRTVPVLDYGHTPPRFDAAREFRALLNLFRCVAGSVVFRRLLMSVGLACFGGGLGQCIVDSGIRRLYSPGIELMVIGGLAIGLVVPLGRRRRHSGGQP